MKINLGIFSYARGMAQGTAMEVCQLVGRSTTLAPCWSVILPHICKRMSHVSVLALHALIFWILLVAFYLKW